MKWEQNTIYLIFIKFSDDLSQKIKFLSHILLCTKYDFYYNAIQLKLPFKYYCSVIIAVANNYRLQRYRSIKTENQNILPVK